MKKIPNLKKTEKKNYKPISKKKKKEMLTGHRTEVMINNIHTSSILGNSIQTYFYPQHIKGI